MTPVGMPGPDLPPNHLARLMGRQGMFEHARYREPRRAHGFTTDDNARAVVVSAGLSSAESVFERCLDFVLAGRCSAGWHNRMSLKGRWMDEKGPPDTVGRVIWALGAASRVRPDGPGVVEAWRHATRLPLLPVRSLSYAVLGATGGDHSAFGAGRRRVLDQYLAKRPRLRVDHAWPWPEDRLTYDNARIPQAMMLAGDAVGDDDLLADGLELLDWLVGVEWHDDRFSFTPAGGRGPGEWGPAFDQQPIEAWAMADACQTAALLTGESRWTQLTRAAAGWFSGRNQGSHLMYDPADGAGFDGLQAHGVNQNAGAESTLALHGAHQAYARLDTIGAVPGAGMAARAELAETYRAATRQTIASSTSGRGAVATETRLSEIP